MLSIHPQYITDTAGKKMVILPAKEFNTMVEELEELDMSYSSSRKPTTKIREDNYGESHHETEGKRSCPRFLGDHSRRVIPVPMPNTVVKPSRADDTGISRESRTLPEL